MPVDEPLDDNFAVKLDRKPPFALKSNFAYEPDRESVEHETLEKYSPSNNRYVINLKESNGYAVTFFVFNLNLNLNF